jgi:hypothetical protein
MVKKKKADTPGDHREYLKLMLTGCYAMPRMANEGDAVYCVYTGNQVPVKYFSKCLAEKYKELYKKDDKNRITINLTKVRQLDGRSFVKKFYRALVKQKV